ncbi:MAG: 50S ribosomal protein L25 [Candidatus Omnitrophota bacterium]
MQEITLEAHVRTAIGTRKTKQLRREDFIPAVVYGERKKTVAIQLDRKTFERIERLHHGENIILSLNVIDDDKKVKDYSAIVKDTQRDPVSGRILHLDLHHISLTKEIEVKVPIVAKGEPVGVKQDGGSLDHLLWELGVICLPTKIPHHIEVDVSSLKIKDVIHVKDIALPEGVKTKQDPDTIVFAVVPPMKEVTPEEAAAAATQAEPEVLKEKKEDPAAAKTAAGDKEKKPAEEKPKAEKSEGK